MPKILAFAGSLREHSYNKRVLNIAVEGAREAGAEVTLIDLRDYPMPVFNFDNYEQKFDENALRFQDLLSDHDGLLIASPEYNGSLPGGMKNAIDWVYPEWNRKAAAFVSYGSAMGARAVQQLRETAIEIQMAPIRSSVHIPVATLWAHFQGGDVDKGLAELEKQANTMIDDLTWSTTTLKTARER